jgi:riboflavin synthase
MVRVPDTGFLNALAIGDSVAVDGACLTVETLTGTGFVVTISPETLQRTTLGQSVDTDWVVNLEPALRVGDRLGGHFVTGHIDGIGQVQSLQQTAESWEIGFTVALALGRYILPKGSVAVNGVSLTVADCTEDGTQFTVAVIPHSFANTNLQSLVSQHAVNIETDVLGKYVAKLLRHPTDNLGAEHYSEITPEFLAEHGFV